MVINMTRIAGTVESSADLTAAFLVLHPRPTPTRGIARRRPDDHPFLRNRLGIGRSGRLVRWGATGAVGELAQIGNPHGTPPDGRHAGVGQPPPPPLSLDPPMKAGLATPRR